MIFTWAMIFTSEQGITENYCRIVNLTKYYDTPSLIARFMGPKWGPSGADRTQVGPMLASWTLLSGIMSLGHNKSNTIGLLRRSSKSSLIFRHGYVISSAIITLLSHNPISSLTHWGQEMHICVSNLTIIGSDNGLLPGQRQAIIWTNAGLLYPPKRSLGGVYWIHPVRPSVCLSVCPSVRPSVRGSVSGW